MIMISNKNKKNVIAPTSKTEIWKRGKTMKGIKRDKDLEAGAATGFQPGGGGEIF